MYGYKEPEEAHLGNVVLLDPLTNIKEACMIKNQTNPTFIGVVGDGYFESAEIDEFHHKKLWTLTTLYQRICSVIQ